MSPSADQVGRGELSYRDYRATSYFPVLDTLRAISVVLVILSHTRGAHAPLPAGANGVLVFFVLSGFLITTLALREEEKLGRLRLRAFYVRRAFRIFPLYFLALAGWVVLVLVLHQGGHRALFVASLPFYLTYLQEVPQFRYGDPPFGVSWSLGIEEKFYLVWPVLAFRRKLPSAVRIGGATLVIAVLTIVGAAHPQAEFFLRPYRSILLGCLIAFVAHEEVGWAAMRFLRRTPGALIALGTAVLIPFMYWMPYSFGRWFPVLLALTMVVVVGNLSVRRFLEQEPLVWLGKRAYGMYLFHQIGLGLGEKLVPANGGLVRDLATFVIGLVVTIIVSDLAFRLIETPLIRLGRAVADRRRDTRRPWPSLPSLRRREVA